MDNEEEDFKEINPQISVYAINGIALRGYRTMRVTMHVKKRALNILIDSGSTHNFLDIKVAKKLSCIIVNINLMRVDVANGSSLSYVAACKGLTL